MLSKLVGHMYHGSDPPSKIAPTWQRSILPGGRLCCRFRLHFLERSVQQQLIAVSDYLHPACLADTPRAEQAGWLKLGQSMLKMFKASP